MVTTIGLEGDALLRSAPGGDPRYLFGLQTIYPALLLSIAALIVVSVGTKTTQEKGRKGESLVS